MAVATNDLLHKAKATAKATVAAAKAKVKLSVDAAKAKTVVAIEKAKEKAKKSADKLKAKAIVDAAKAKAKATIAAVKAKGAIAVEKAKAKAKKCIDDAKVKQKQRKQKGGEEGYSNLKDELDALKEALRPRPNTKEAPPSPIKPPIKPPAISVDEGIAKANNCIDNIHGTIGLSDSIRKHYINFYETYNVKKKPRDMSEYYQYIDARVLEIRSDYPTNTLEQNTRIADDMWSTQSYNLHEKQKIADNVFGKIVSKYLTINRYACKKEPGGILTFKGYELLITTINELKTDITTEYGDIIYKRILNIANSTCSKYDELVFPGSGSGFGE